MRLSTAVMVAVAWLGLSAAAFGQDEFQAPVPVSATDEAPPAKKPEAPKAEARGTDAGLKAEAAPKAETETTKTEAPKAETETTATESPKSDRGSIKIKIQPQGPPPAAAETDKPLLVSKATDADLEAALTRYRTALAATNLNGAEQAQRELVALKAELGALDLEPFALALMRASNQREQQEDSAGAVGAARAAVEVAPDFPFAHLRLAGAYFAADKTELGRCFSALAATVRTFFADPRYLRPALMDFATSLFFALLATSIAVVGVFFLRRARFFLHDFHHVFPRGIAPWQAYATGAILLTLPLVFRLGVVPQLFALLFAVSLYLTRAERLLVCGLLIALGLSPLAAGEVVTATDFAGTPAEDVYLAERGGVLAASATQKILRRVQTASASYGEVYALGRYELRRGQLDDAISHLKLAGALRNNQAPLLTNLGNALLVKGDFDGAAEMYKTAMAADPNFAPAPFNLSRLHSRRATTLSADGAAKEKLLADDAYRTATTLQPAFSAQPESPEGKPLANLTLLSPPLGTDELKALAAAGGHGDKIQAQLSSFLLGELEPPLSTAYPLILGLAALLFGIGGARISIGSECSKCGRPVCRRCDPELPEKGELCSQCVHVFSRRGAVTGPARVRKQLEIDRFHERTDRISYVLGLACSGAGHLFAGAPVAGATYAFFFLFALCSVFFHEGVVRSPYAEWPLAARLIPVSLLLLAVYLSSLRGLFKRTSE
ncbi:MAG: tetratricopeptide repeat protein [Myxococcaceae bacterium]